MPVATLRFRLPEEEPEHRYALAGRDALITLETIDQWCRGQLKYGDPGKDVAAVLEEIRRMIPYEMLELLV